MSRLDVTEKIIATKVAKGLKWSDVATKVGLSKEWVTAGLPRPDDADQRTSRRRRQDLRPDAGREEVADGRALQGLAADQRCRPIR